MSKGKVRMSSTMWWILLAVVVVVVVIIWLAMSAKRRRDEQARVEAARLREGQEQRAAAVRDQQAKADAVAAKAAQAREEADRKAQEAERLEREAKERAGAAGALQDDYLSRTREADRLDPDVRTDAEGNRLDDDRAQDAIEPETPAAASAPAAASQPRPTTHEGADLYDRDRVDVRHAEATRHETAVADERDQLTSDDRAVEPHRRRVSEIDEVSDGGYGVGSAAPIHDGAQPLGHSVRGWKDSSTFRTGEESAEHGEPDVWFYDEQAAERAGFTRARD